MTEVSAGLLLFRRRPELQVFLVHPGGPYWRGKDEGAWSIPKGLTAAGEDPLLAARREFKEETGFDIEGEFFALETLCLPSGKLLKAWAIEGDCDPASLTSNTFEIAWPPRSGKHQSFPEIDRGGWFGHASAVRKITKGQRPLIERLFAEHAGGSSR